MRAAVGWAEEVFEPPTALQSLINCCDQRRPPGAGLKGSGTLSTDKLGKPGFPRVSEGGILVDLGGAETNSEMAIELLAPDKQAKVVICNAPIVEGAVMAATEAWGGASLQEVKRTAEELSPA